MALRARRTVRDERIKRRFAAAFLPDRAALAAYERELQASGILDHLRAKGREFDEAVKNVPGPRHTIGAIAYLEGINLYAVLRTVRPRIAVETGVCNGFSTAFSLLALERNGEGRLYSIDLPRMIGTDYEAGTFFEGKGLSLIHI